MIPRAIPLLLIAFVAACGQPETPPAQPTAPTLGAVASATNRPAPDFTFTGLDGAQVSMADYRGKVVLVNFWATWCAPCREEIPDLIALQDRFGTDDFAVLGVASILYDEDAAEVQTFVDDFGMDYPILLDKGPAGQAFGGVFALPTSYVIDRSHTIRARSIGLPDSSFFLLVDQLVTAD